VYNSPWIDGSSFASRKALTLVVLVSQRGFRLKADILGKLGMQQFAKFLSRWYRSMQAILKNSNLAGSTRVKKYLSQTTARSRLARNTSPKSRPLTPAPKVVAKSTSRLQTNDA